MSTTTDMLFIPAPAPKLARKDLTALHKRVATTKDSDLSEHECPCCWCAFPPADFADHLAAPSSWCDRDGWGMWIPRSEVQPEPDDVFGRRTLLELDVAEARRSNDLLGRAVRRHVLGCHDTSVGELMVDLGEHDMGMDKF